MRLNSQCYEVIGDGYLQIFPVEDALVGVGPELVEIAHVVFAADGGIEAQRMQVVDRIIDHHIVRQHLVITPGHLEIEMAGVCQEEIAMAGVCGDREQLVDGQKRLGDVEVHG